MATSSASITGTGKFTTVPGRKTMPPSTFCPPWARANPSSALCVPGPAGCSLTPQGTLSSIGLLRFTPSASSQGFRSEEHTSELQSRENLVCRLLLEKKKNTTYHDEQE